MIKAAGVLQCLKDEEDWTNDPETLRVALRLACSELVNLGHE